MTLQLDTPIQHCLWFDHEAEAAALFYTAVFPYPRMGSITRHGAVAHMPEGTVLTVDFEPNGQPWTALNGGPAYAFKPAVSWQIVPQPMLDALPWPESPARQRLMAATIGTKKLDITALESAYSQA